MTIPPGKAGASDLRDHQQAAFTVLDTVNIAGSNGGPYANTGPREAAPPVHGVQPAVRAPGCSALRRLLAGPVQERGRGPPLSTPLILASQTELQPFVFGESRCRMDSIGRASVTVSA